MNIEIKENFKENISEVLKVLGPENGEYSISSDVPPLEAFVTSLIKANKFENKKAMYDTLRKIAIKGDKGAISEYATETYKDLTSEEKEAVSDIILATVDYGNDELAYAKHLLSTEKIVGLMTIQGKSPESYADDGDIFQDKTVWNKIGSDGLVNFPQFLNEFGPLKEIVDSMDTDFFKDIASLISDNEDSSETLTKLLVVADIGSMFIKMFQKMSEISKGNSTLKEKSIFTKPEDFEEGDDIDEDYWDSIEEKMVQLFRTSIIKLSKKEAAKTARNIRDAIEDEFKDGMVKNLEYLVEGRYKALSDKKYNIVTAAEILDYYIKDDADEKPEIFKALIPICYAAALTESPLSDFIDLDSIDKFIEEDQDEYFDIEDFSAGDMDSVKLSDTIAIDYNTGGIVATHYLGVYEKEEFYKQLASKTIPLMSYEYFEERLSSSYDTKVTLRAINDMLAEDYASFSDNTGEIVSAAKAIYDAVINE